MKFIDPENSKFKCIVLIKCQRKNIRITGLERRLSSCAYCLLFQRIQVLTPVPWYLTPSHKLTYRQNSNAHNIKVILKLLSLGVVMHACETKAGILLYRWKPTHLIYFANSKQASYVIFVKTTLKKLNQIVVFFIVSYMKLEMWLNGRVLV